MKSLIIGLILSFTFTQTGFAYDQFSGEIFESEARTSNMCAFSYKCGKAKSEAKRKAKLDCRKFALKNRISPDRCKHENTSVTDKGLLNYNICFNPLASDTFCGASSTFYIE